MIIYATSRSGVDTYIETTATNTILYGKLDITSKSSIQTFFESTLKAHGTIDVLINNAAVSHDFHETPRLAAETIWTNYGGTRDMCRAFLTQPILRPGSRIVNVVSGYNGLQTYGADLQTAFRSTESISALDNLARSYIDCIRRGQKAQEQAGWGSGARSYKVSKALVNTLTISLARQYPNILVNCCCPGWVNTDMGNQANGKPPKTLEEGARVPIRLAIGDLGSSGDGDGSFSGESERVSGYFYENDSIVQPGWGKAKLWLAS